MGYNEDEQMENEKDEEKYKPMDEKDIEAFYSDTTGTNNGYGEESESWEDEAE